jgi:serine/threonine protein kinase
MAQLLLAMNFMHLNGWVHRDIKPANLLVMDRKDLYICIGDLGLSCPITDADKLIKKCGTPGYIGPELLGG